MGKLLTPKIWNPKIGFVYLGIRKKIKVMFKKIDFKYLVGAVGALGLGLLTMAGVVQQYVHFAGVANEMGFALMAIFMSIICIFGIKK
jgi:hypothetical protein